MDPWFCTTDAVWARTSAGLIPWGCVETEGGVEDKTCIEAWAGRPGNGADI